jgi:hypothetical protein
MTRAEYQALFPEFGASTYDARIDALLPVVPDIDASKAGARLNFILGLWMSDQLANQDITITFGSSSSSASSSTTTEKRVGDVSVKRGIANSSGSGSGSSSRPGQTTYGARYEEEVRHLGLGALAS